MDKFETDLELKLKELNSCPLRASKSCMNCKKFFTCNIRKDYVTAVYNSMSKGKQGGFEF